MIYKKVLKIFIILKLSKLYSFAKEIEIKILKGFTYQVLSQ